MNSPKKLYFGVYQFELNFLQFHTHSTRISQSLRVYSIYCTTKIALIALSLSRTHQESTWRMRLMAPTLKLYRFCNLQRTVDTTQSFFSTNAINISDNLHQCALIMYPLHLLHYLLMQVLVSFSPLAVQPHRFFFNILKPLNHVVSFRY